MPSLIVLLRLASVLALAMLARTLLRRWSAYSREVDPRISLSFFSPQKGSSAETATLHATEHWRDRLIADDDAVTDWLAQFPDTDTQQLRALVRQARKDHIAPDARAVSEGQAPRQGRAFRDLFVLLREQLQAAHKAATEGDAAEDESNDD